MQFVSDNIDDLWLEATNSVVNQGMTLQSRVGGCREVIAATLVLTNTQRNFLTNPVRKLSPVYANAELLWYLSGSAKTEMIEAYAPSYGKFAEDGIAHGAYGKRIAGSSAHQFAWTAEGAAHPDEINIPFDETRSFGVDIPKGNQIDFVIRLLKEKPETRQAIIQMWKDIDLIHAYRGNKKDLPCTLNLQFFLRQGRLTCITTMRSNDLWLGTPYDIYCFSSIHRLIAEEVGCEVGDYVHQVGSLHLYDKNLEKANEAQDFCYDDNSPTHKYEGVRSYDKVQDCIQLEWLFRQGYRTGVRRPGIPPRFSLMRNVIGCVGSKWSKDLAACIDSPLLAGAL